MELRWICSHCTHPLYAGTIPIVGPEIGGDYVPGNLGSSGSWNCGSWICGRPGNTGTGGGGGGAGSGSGIRICDAVWIGASTASDGGGGSVAGDGVATRLEGGNFPATLADLTDEKFLAEESEYFGGQKINEVLSASATGVVPDWQYLPYQVYANSIFPDTVGQAYTGSTPLSDGLTAWQESIVKYGNEQGFTVSE